MGEFTKVRGDTWIFDLPITRLNAQTVLIEGTPTGGTFTLTYTSQDGRTETTYGIAYNANAAAVQTALETLPNVASGDVTVSGGPGPGTAWTVTINTPGAYVISAVGTFTGGTGTSIRVESAPFDGHASDTGCTWHECRRETRRDGHPFDQPGCDQRANKQRSGEHC